MTFDLPRLMSLLLRQKQKKVFQSISMYTISNSVNVVDNIFHKFFLSLFLPDIGRGPLQGV